jgi:PAS domain S-box-containing protein
MPWTVEAAAEALRGRHGDPPKLRRIFEHSPVPMMIVDGTRRPVEINRRARLTFGLSLDDTRTVTVDDLTPSHLTAEVEEAWARLLDAGSVAGRFQSTRRDGSRLDVIYCGLADVLPGLHLIAFAPSDWLEDGWNATEEGRRDRATALTPREIEVLALAADGHTGPELAHALALSPATINAHFKNMYKKLEVRSRGAAIAEAMRLGLID